MQRVHDGMPIDEAKELFWQEARAEGLVARDLEPPLPATVTAAE